MVAYVVIQRRRSRYAVRFTNLPGNVEGFFKSVSGLRYETDVAEGRLALSPADAARAVITYTRGLVVIERLYSDTDRLRQATDLMLLMLFRDAA